MIHTSSPSEVHGSYDVNRAVETASRKLLPEQRSPAFPSARILATVNEGEVDEILNGIGHDLDEPYRSQVNRTTIFIQNVSALNQRKGVQPHIDSLMANDEVTPLAPRVFITGYSSYMPLSVEGEIDFGPALDRVGPAPSGVYVPEWLLRQHAELAQDCIDAAVASDSASIHPTGNPGELILLREGTIHYADPETPASQFISLPRLAIEHMISE